MSLGVAHLKIEGKSYCPACGTTVARFDLEPCAGHTPSNDTGRCMVCGVSKEAILDGLAPVCPISKATA
jgi:hypothetical protein